MSDILSQGRDRGPRPWRRRQVVLAVVAGLLAAVVLTHLPRPGTSVANAAFSPDGSYLALQVNVAPGGADGGSATQLEVLATATGHLTTVPDTSLSSDALIGFGWPPGGDRRGGCPVLPAGSVGRLSQSTSSEG